MDITDYFFNGTTYRGWHIEFTSNRFGYMYEAAAPGQGFAGTLQGLPHQTIDECFRYAKKSIDTFLGV